MNVNPNMFPQNQVGFGDMGNVAVLNDLTKALEAGTGVDAGSMGGGRALIPESLENTLVNVLWSQDEARLFKRVKKQAVPSPIHQWNKRTAVGAPDGAWVAEGGTSQEADQTIARVYKEAKYLQTLRKATLQATLSNMIENAMTIEQNAGALWIIREVERAMFYGDSSMVAEQPDGLLAQITDTDNILDVRGAAADSAEFEKKTKEAARVIRDSYGKGSLMLTSTMVMQDVQNLLSDRVRFAAGNAGSLNAIADEYKTPFGNLELLDDVFIKEGAAPSASALSGAPATPTESSAPASAAVASQFTAADVGAYIWTVEAINAYGASAIKDMTTANSVENQHITMTVGHDTTTTAVRLYRSKLGGSAADVRYVKTVAVATPGTSTTTVVIDDNANLPGTSQVFILTMDQIYDAIEYFQFLPLMKFDLYPTNQAVYPFLMLLFGALALKKQEQHAYIKNVSPSAMGWF